MERRKQSIRWEFEKYRQLLKEKELPCQQAEEEAAAAQASLEQEKGETASKLELRREAIIRQSQVLWSMIVELEERSQRPVRWMLQERVLDPAAARANLLGAEDRLPCARTKRDPEDICSGCASRSRHSLLPPCRFQGQKKCALWSHPAEPA